MLHQAEEERQILPPGALFIKRQDVAAALGLQHEVGVLDALGDAFARQRAPQVVPGEESLQLVVADFGVNSHNHAG